MDIEGAYIGEIRLFPYNFVPVGWAKCDGAVLPIEDYQVLYALVGDTFGGTPPQNFKLPTITPPTIDGTAYYICTGQKGGTFPSRS